MKGNQSELYSSKLFLQVWKAFLKWKSSSCYIKMQKPTPFSSCSLQRELWVLMVRVRNVAGWTTNSFFTSLLRNTRTKHHLLSSLLSLLFQMWYHLRVLLAADDSPVCQNVSKCRKKTISTSIIYNSLTFFLYPIPTW